VVIGAPADAIERLRLAEGDLRAVGRIRAVDYIEADSIAVAEIELAPEPVTEA
jgi:valyl-tRNA synthetase